MNAEGQEPEQIIFQQIMEQIEKMKENQKQFKTAIIDFIDDIIKDEDIK